MCWALWLQYKLPSEFSQCSPRKGGSACSSTFEATGTTSKASLFNPPRPGPKYLHKALFYGEGTAVQMKHIQGARPKAELQTTWSSALLGFNQFAKGQAGSVTDISLYQKTS